MKIQLFLHYFRLPTIPAKRPIIGNGYVGGVVRNEGVHMMGIYKGKRQHSRRAFIPSTFNHNYTVVFGEKELKMRVAYQIDMSTGWFLYIFVYFSTYHCHHCSSFL